MMQEMAKMDMRMGAHALKFRPGREEPYKMREKWGMQMDDHDMDMEEEDDHMDMDEENDHHMDMEEDDDHIWIWMKRMTTTWIWRNTII
jgi:hypothetical protein